MIRNKILVKRFEITFNKSSHNFLNISVHTLPSFNQQLSECTEEDEKHFEDFFVIAHDLFKRYKNSFIIFVKICNILHTASALYCYSCLNRTEDNFCLENQYPSQIANAVSEASLLTTEWKSLCEFFTGLSVHSRPWMGTWNATTLLQNRKDRHVKKIAQSKCEWQKIIFFS